MYYLCNFVQLDDYYCKYVHCYSFFIVTLLILYLIVDNFLICVFVNFCLYIHAPVIVNPLVYNTMSRQAQAHPDCRVLYYNLEYHENLKHKNL